MFICRHVSAYESSHMVMPMYVRTCNCTWACVFDRIYCVGCGKELGGHEAAMRIAEQAQDCTVVTYSDASAGHTYELGWHE